MEDVERRLNIEHKMAEDDAWITVISLECVLLLFANVGILISPSFLSQSVFCFCLVPGLLDFPEPEGGLQEEHDRPLF